MSIFSYPFFALWAVCAVLYYTIAGNHQWLLLLGMSLVFYGYSVMRVPVILILVSTVTYLGAVWITYARKNKKASEKTIKRCRRGITALCVAALLAGPATGWFVLLGNSYFILKAISYLMDTDRDETVCEKNYFFYLLYLIYLPTILQGPFNRFARFRESLREKKAFQYEQFMHGLQRFIWGAFKKLVLAARLEQIASYVSGSFADQSGISILTGIMAYSLWFYTDFSSYMDMMLGMSGTFGIGLPENFRQPYFSKTTAEFWRRWHITLGGVFKDYLMMPFIQSGYGRRLRKYFKGYGKEAGRVAPLLAGTFLVWLTTALWHGCSVRYLVWGMYYCGIISSSLVLEGTYGRIKKRLRITGTSVVYSGFCMVRTWCVLFVANMILQAEDFGEFLVMVRQLIGRSFFVGGRVSLSALGWIRQDGVVLAAGLLMVLFVSVMEEKNVKVLEVIDRQRLPVRWSVYYILLFSVLLFGIYGSGYDAGQFLYMQF